MARHIDGAIAERSRTQLGLIQRTQALDLGLTEAQLRRRVSSGALEVAQPRVLRVGGAPITWEQHLVAGLLGLGDDAVVSHMSAAARTASSTQER